MSEERKPTEEDLVRDLPVEKGAGDVKGGRGQTTLRTPAPSGPIPIPYPNLPK